MAIDPATALALAKSIAETAKSLIGAKSEKELIPIRQALTSAYQTALELQVALATANNRVANLENENRQMREFADRREQYALHEITTGVFVYRAKPTQQGEESNVCVCTHCIEEGKISILQRKTEAFQGIYTCPRCKMRIADGTFETPSF